ncbi:ComF family protein [Shewanella marinintestina]|uniref:ComF family protein n=1 Tax=Shewanella marinintestina TaxID=190305 RepID=UPI00200E7E19|nr:ComF family protein [Shewanella marinintestina]MCL1147287.1 ComF family protein [Shewanella marinintestina]
MLPNRCLMCHQHIVSDHSGLCAVCLKACCYQTEICLGCGKELTLPMALCGKCMLSDPILVIAPCRYHDGIGHWVGQIKYQAQFAVIEVLVEALVLRLIYLERLGLVELPQVLIPVPLHRNRLRQRGFNQAWIIAKALSKRLNIPLIDDMLFRVRDTKPQAGLSGKLRRKNLQSAFELTDEFNWQRVALIDDVVTTGTTVKEIAKLFQYKHVQVQVWCLARAEAPGVK